jgi:hypothetical protein
MSFTNIFFLCFQLIFFIGAPLLLGTGVYYIVHAIRNPRKAKDMDTWSSTFGKVTQMVFPGRPGWLNNAVLKYEYNVAGQDYVGKNLTLFPNMVFGKDNVKRLEEAYPQGSKVTVYYNPQNPKEAVLEKDVEKLPIYFLIWGIMNTLLGIFLSLIIIQGLTGGI